MGSSSLVVDADGHIMEPPSMWRDNIDDAFRDNCIHVVRDASDGDKFILNGTCSQRVRRLGGVRPADDASTVNWNYLNDRDFYEAYADSLIPASFDSAERLRWMDNQGIDISVLFPSLGLIWPNEIVADPNYVRAHMWAYDRWILQFASADRDRLVPVAQVALFDDDLAAQDVSALHEAGFRHIMLPVVDDATGSCFQDTFNRFWTAVEERCLVTHLHKAAIPHQLNIPRGAPLGSPGNGSFFAHVNETLPAQMCLASIMDNRMPDRYPTITYTFLECNAGWLPAWLDRSDESHEVLATKDVALLNAPPRHYIESTDAFFFGVGMTEDVARFIDFGDKLLMSTDFPHPDAPLETVREWETLIKDLPAEQVSNILGENAQRFLSRVS